MSFDLAIALWEVIGISCAACMWALFDGPRCPSPRAILGIVFFGSIGGGFLLFGLVVFGVFLGLGYLIDEAEERWHTFSRVEAWFKRPICK